MNTRYVEAFTDGGLLSINRYGDDKEAGSDGAILAVVAAATAKVVELFMLLQYVSKKITCE